MKVYIHTAIAALPEDQRLAISLFYIGEYSQKEIADFLEVPVSTVKKRLFTARKRLFERMEQTMTEYLQENRPSENEQFSDAIQLFLALQVNDETTVQRLIKKDPSLINIKCEYHDDLAREMAWWPVGFTPLEWAASLGQKNLVELLIDHKADTNALHTAVYLEQPAMIDLLLANNADVNLVSFNDQTPLHYAAIRGSRSMAEELVNAGAIIEAKDSSGRTPLDWASINGRTDVVNLLSGNDSLMTSEPSSVPSQLEAPSGPLLETGIKIIDLFAPIKRGSRVGLLTPSYGLGQLVVLGEMIYNLARRQYTRAIWVGVEKRRGGVESVRQCPRKAFVSEKMDVVYGLIDDPVEAQAQLVQQAISQAETHREQGHTDVILIIESSLAMAGHVSALDTMTSITDNGAITTIFIGFWDDLATQAKATFDSLDTVITFDPARAKQHHYPTIDPLKSTVSRLDSALVSDTHRDIAQQARDLLTQYADLHETVEAQGIETLSTTDQPIARRARRLDRFLTQPFATASMFTAMPGKYVSLAQTLDDCAAILAGEVDDMPEADFLYVGEIQDI